MFTIVRSAAIPSRLEADSMMRMFAWCGTNHATSEAATPARSSVVLADGDGLRGRRHAAAAGADLEQPGSRAVAAEVPREDARPVVGGATEDGGGGAVAEEDGCRPVVGVDDAAEDLGPDDQDVIEVAGGQERRADNEHVDEAGAPRAEVERATAKPEALADERTGVGDRLLGAGGGHDEQVDRVGWDPGILDGRRAGVDGERCGRVRRRGDVPLPNAGALDDPRVRGVDALLHLGIRDEFLGNGRPPAADAGPHRYATRSQATGSP